MYWQAVWQEMIDTDVRRFEELLGAITDAAYGVGEYVKKVSSALNTETDPSKGISLLEVKVHTQLSYLNNLALLVLKKVNGKAIGHDAVVDRLAELRIVSERMRSVEQKLSYQIEKLIQSLSSDITVAGARDPLSFKPHPQGMNEDSDEVDSESEDEEGRAERSTANRKYVPPKLMATPYTEPKDRAAEKLRRRIMNTGMLQDLQKQYSQAPEEIRDNQSLMKHREILEKQRETEYEEEHYIRVRQSKRNANNSSHAQDSLARAFDFAGYFASSSGTQRKRKRASRKGKRSRKKRNTKR
uniref:Sas10 C-terminal domain-containing protein n=1 Tax=Trichuris muris TaxID=70415 RepID=A0A5S6QJ54_TRIMR